LTANAEATAAEKKNTAAGSARKKTAEVKGSPSQPGSQSCFSLKVGKVRFHMPGKIRGLNAFGD
jgi:hypothetical protein